MTAPPPEKDPVLLPRTPPPIVRTSLCDVKGVPGKKNPSDSSEMSDPSPPGTNHGKENIEILEKPAPPIRPIRPIGLIKAAEFFNVVFAGFSR